MIIRGVLFFRELSCIIEDRECSDIEIKKGWAMLKLQDVIEGEYTLRAMKNRDNDVDYFIDHEGKPLVLEGDPDLHFIKVSTILIRIGEGDIFTIHLLRDRDLLSSMAFIELNAKIHKLTLHQTDHVSQLSLMKTP